MASTYQRVLTVISAAPTDRNDRDIDSLLPWFKRKSELFSSLENDVVRDIMKNCEFRRYVTDDVIIKQGGKGHSFFVVLNGSISIYIAADEDETPPVANDNPGPSPSRDIRDELGTCIRNLGPGTSFGELALIDSASIRKASVVADEPSDFIVVDRKLYSRSLKFAQKRDLDEKRNFVENHPLFNMWKGRHKSILAMSLSRKRAGFGNRLVQQGSEVSHVLFILRGQAKVSISPWKHPNRRIMERQRGKFPKTPNDVSDMKNDDVTRTKSAPNDTTFDICSIGPGDMIGDIELTCDFTEHAQTITCLESVEAFQLDLTNFQKLVTKRNPLTLDRMRIAAQMKLRARVIRAHNESLIFFLELLLKKLSSVDEPKPQDDMRTDLWMTQRGPIIDDVGPGSLYYRAKRLDAKFRRKKERRERKDTNVLSQEQNSDAIIQNSSNFNSFTYNVGKHSDIQIVESQVRKPTAILWTDSDSTSSHNVKSDMQRSSVKGVTFESENPRDWSRYYGPQAPTVFPSFLHLNRRCISQSTARGISESIGSDRWVRSAPSTASTSHKITVTQDGQPEVQVLRKQFSADEYKGLKERLRLQEKRHMRYLCSLW